MSDRSFEYEVVASPLHDRARLADLYTKVGERLGRIGGVGSAGSTSTSLPFVVVVGTGGSERRIIDRWENRQASMPGEPALIVAHEADNSLPAALEALAAIRQAGGRGRIAMLDRLADVAAALHDQQAFLALQRCRLGVVGDPSDWLVASTPSPAIVRKHWGPTLIPMEVPGADDVVRTEVAVELGRRWAARDTGNNVDRRDVDKAAAVHGPLSDLMAANEVDAITVRCFDLLSTSTTSGCIALAELNANGIVAGCEGDVPSAIAMLWVKALLGATAWMANPASIDVVGGTVELAHCTIAPNLVDAFALETHFESDLGIGIAGRFRPQPVTLIRIGGAHLDQIWLADGDLVANGSSDHLCRTQASVVIRSELARDLLERPLGNHVVMISGHHQAQLHEWWRLFIDH